MFDFFVEGLAKNIVRSHYFRRILMSFQDQITSLTEQLNALTEGELFQAATLISNIGELKAAVQAQKDEIVKLQGELANFPTELVDFSGLQAAIDRVAAIIPDEVDAPEPSVEPTLIELPPETP